ncbi:hypothetical protein V22_04140 [Calycomorphotria hydatis]|uniref:Uncharacterized protein n=1 Tax=Calycomorphotria hydatis TaxID=2528027 RepID=A0A517T489_9PLAN|nr:hypothetical protein V22_04140 [Calycomorphotria hydatis]
MKPLLLNYSSENLLPMNGNFFRSVNTDTNLITAHIDNRYPNGVADHDGFVAKSRENEHAENSFSSHPVLRPEWNLAMKVMQAANRSVKHLLCGKCRIGCIDVARKKIFKARGVLAVCGERFSCSVYRPENDWAR